MQVEEIEPDLWGQDRQRSPSHRHLKPRCPAPFAPWGTLLYAVQLARYETRGALSSHAGGDRDTCMRFAKTHGGLLVGVHLTSEQIGFVRECRIPWAYLLERIREAMRPRVRQARPRAKVPA